MVESIEYFNRSMAMKTKIAERDRVKMMARDAFANAKTFCLRAIKNAKKCFAMRPVSRRRKRIRNFWTIYC